MTIEDLFAHPSWPAFSEKYNPSKAEIKCILSSGVIAHSNHNPDIELVETILQAIRQYGIDNIDLN